MIINFKPETRVLIRVDYNVPIENEKILDLTRIQSSIPTIEYFLKKKMKIFLISHLGRPKKRDSKHSLKKLIKPLKKLLGINVGFIPDITTKPKIPIQTTDCQIFLLENLRFYSGETENDLQFAKVLAKYGDIYVNDAFGVSHRNHASVSAIHKFFTSNMYKGFLLESELKELQNLKINTKKPYTVIVGGSKIGSKIHMLKTFLNIADNILIGGGMAFPFIKCLGGEIGSSICKDTELDVVRDFLNE